MKEVALITGGTRGIGLGIAKSLASKGYHLVLNGMRDLSEVHSIIQELKQDFNEVKYIQGNVGVAADRKRIIEYAIAEFGHINFLINNAGVAPLERNDILEMTEESFDRVMNINLKSAVFLSQQAAKAMINAKGVDDQFNASIINISSISANVVSIARGEYCMSKSGMSMLTQLLAARLGQEGIPVYEVRPGVIATDMTSAVQKKYDDLFDSGNSVAKRWGLPEDVGKAVLSLVEGDFPYSTGQVIMVDGGLTIPIL